jgi:aquaporin Z
MPIGKRVFAEFLGTFVLVLIGVGVTVLAPSMAMSGVGHLGASLATGLTAAAMLFALGHVSGAHLNPTVTVGMIVGRRFPAKDAMPYMLAQVLGATLGAATLYLIATGRTGFMATPGTFAANGIGELSMGRFSLLSGIVAELVLSFVIAFVFVSTNERRSLAAMAPIAVGMTTGAAHLVAFPVTGGGLNPARSTAVALIAGGAAVGQLALFWLAPLVGGALAGIAHTALQRAPAGGESEGT